MMTNPQCHWWGIFWPRASAKGSIGGRIVSVLGGQVVLLLGSIVALFQIITFPILAAIILVTHGILDRSMLRASENAPERP